MALPPLLSFFRYIPITAFFIISSSLGTAEFAVLACVVSSKGLMFVYGGDREGMQRSSLWGSVQLCGAGGATW